VLSDDSQGVEAALRDSVSGLDTNARLNSVSPNLEDVFVAATLGARARKEAA
jgi:hypothetical protein